jgi:hypothetical protein
MFRIRRAKRYQRGNHNPYIEEKQTTQWPKEKVQMDKQRSTTAFREPLKTYERDTKGIEEHPVQT